MTLQEACDINEKTGRKIKPPSSRSGAYFLAVMGNGEYKFLGYSIHHGELKEGNRIIQEQGDDVCGFQLSLQDIRSDGWEVEPDRK